MRERAIVLASMALALILLATKTYGLLHSVRDGLHGGQTHPARPRRFKVDSRDLLLDNRGTSVAAFARQRGSELCVVSSGLEASAAAGLCAKRSGSAIVSLCLTQGCTGAAMADVPTIASGGVRTLASVATALRSGSVLFMDANGNCLAP